MPSYLKSLNPVPGFPAYTGPHKVGTIDVELPVAELDAPSPCPDESIRTVQFRIFYPCEREAKPGRSVNWLPNPQREHVSAYTRFLGAGSTLADVISFFPGLLHFISIPVRKNAPLLQPDTPSKRWPVMIFSHGLAGSRNAYSHLVGSIASHGVIVIAPEHRDGSCPVTFIREVPDKLNASSEKSPLKKARRQIDYRRISHTPSPEVEAGRTEQLKIRTWELGCIHDALLKMDKLANLSNLNSSSSSLVGFGNQMDIHEPGSISFAGHSFGGATVAQFVKSVFLFPENSNAPSEYEPLFTPSSRAAIATQITANTPLILLDMWCLPLRIASARWLWNKPIPCYAPGGPGGCGVLAVESQAFVKWRVHLKSTKRFLSPDPSSNNCVIEDPRPTPHFYYANASAHLSQSDFGILFPWVTKKFLGAEEPERVMKLNVRAILQLLREHKISVSATSAADMEIGSEADIITKDDVKIFMTGEEIRGWKYLTTDVSDLSDVEMEDELKADANVEPSDSSVDEVLVKEREVTTGMPLEQAVTA